VRPVGLQYHRQLKKFTMIDVTRVDLPHRENYKKWVRKIPEKNSKKIKIKQHNQTVLYED